MTKFSLHKSINFDQIIFKFQGMFSVYLKVVILDPACFLTPPDILPVDLHLISEISSLKNPVQQTWFVVYFEHGFYFLCSLQKSK